MPKMKEKKQLPALGKKVVNATIRRLIESDCWSIIITLIGGEQIFGDFHYLPQLFSETGKEFEREDFFTPTKWKDKSYALKLSPIEIIFNSPKGEIHGHANVMWIPESIIADIRPFVWSEKSTGRQSIKNIPNPYAEIIYRNNLDIAKKYNLQQTRCVECALSEAVIPESGIQFKEDEIIYVDWEFFEHINSSLTVSVGASGSGVSACRTIHQLAFDKLKGGIIETILKILHIKEHINEVRISGYLIMPETEITTSIEGEDCLVGMCSESKTISTNSKFMPIIIKRKAISYPFEFLKYISSSLVFYGEMKQIPILIQNIKFDKAILVRIIGYVKDSC